jgi:HlyD family secretion protein
MQSLSKLLRWPILFGTIVVSLFVAVFLVWGVLAPLDVGAIASGRISPEGSSRTVQHLEGGIIEELVVRDGDVVEAGDPLVVLRSIQARASFEVLRGRQSLLRAQMARLRAEQNGLAEVAFPEDLEASRATDRPIDHILTTQSDLFEQRNALHNSRLSILRERVGQLRAEITGLYKQIDAQDRRALIIEEEIFATEELLELELAPRPRLLALQREQASIEEQRARAAAAIARAQRQIGETEVQMISINAQRLDEVVQELNAVQAESLEVGERLLASEDVLERTVVEAPISGTVVALKYKTEGGVIQPGSPILDIVPDNEALIIDARLSPLDIDSVYPGLEALVYLSALSQRDMPRITGEVLDVSADAFTDETTGASYFRVRVEVDPEQLENLGTENQLTPGMPAEVVIVTGERTLMDYLISPIRDSMRRALRET